jgi:hypothetical protein
MGLRQMEIISEEDKMDCLIKIEEFIKCVDIGFFIDYDGFGYLATETHQSDIRVYPSSIKEEASNQAWATHIVWYNR